MYASCRNQGLGESRLLFKDSREFGDESGGSDLHLIIQKSCICRVLSTQPQIEHPAVFSLPLHVFFGVFSFSKNMAGNIQDVAIILKKKKFKISRGNNYDER